MSPASAAAPQASRVRFSWLTKAYLVLAPLPLALGGAYAGLLGVTFDRCQKNCVGHESAFFIPIYGVIVAAVLLCAAGTAIACWTADEPQRMLRRSVAFSILGAALWFGYWAVYVTAQVNATT